MLTRTFTAHGDPAWKDGTEMTLELEASGAVSWRIWNDGLDYGGDTLTGSGPERFEQAASEMLASGHWQETCPEHLSA